MFSVMTQLFSDFPAESIGEFSSLQDAIDHALTRFQHGALTWVSEDDFAIVTAEEIEARFHTEHPFA